MATSNLSSLRANVLFTCEAYKAMSDHYGWWILLPHEQFSRIVDPSDQVFILLAANCTSTLSFDLFQPRAMIFSIHSVIRIQGRATNIPFAGISIKQIMAVITEVEKAWSPQKQNAKDNIDEGMGRWLRWLNRQVEPGLVRYNQWPMWVQEQLERDPGFFGKAVRGGKPIERSCVGYAKLIT